MRRYYSNIRLRYLTLPGYIFELMSYFLVDKYRGAIRRRMLLIVKTFILQVLLLLHVILLRCFFSLMMDCLILLNVLLNFVLIFNLLFNFICYYGILGDFGSLGWTSSACFKYFWRKRVFLLDVLICGFFGFLRAYFANLPHSFSDVILRNLRIFQLLVSYVIVRVITSLAALVALITIFVMFSRDESLIGNNSLPFGLSLLRELFVHRLKSACFLML